MCLWKNTCTPNVQLDNFKLVFKGESEIYLLNFTIAREFSIEKNNQNKIEILKKHK